MRLCLDAFGRAELTSLAGARGLSFDQLISESAAQLAHALQTDRRRRDVRVPRLDSTGANPKPVEVVLELDAEQLASLQAEADDQGIEPHILIRHAAMLALANWVPSTDAEQGYEATGDSPKRGAADR